MAKKDQATEDFTQTQAFKDAVAEASKQAVQSALAEITSGAAVRAAATNADDPLAFARGLAVALAELGNQGIGKGKPVSPEVLAQRETARKRMFDLIVETNKSGEVPMYALKHQQYLGEQKIDPYWRGADHKMHKTEIEWPGVPNHGMEPINEPAERIFEAFLESVGTMFQIGGKFATDPARLRVTAKGLVVHGDPSAARHDSPVATDGPTHGLVVRGRGANTGRPVRVLGTVAAPALEQ